jgi:phosphohistidine swiveling domain-containing protein
MLKFSTKANTLNALSACVSKSSILPQITFKVGELLSRPEEIKERILAELSGPFIVRSSALNEDTESASLAGQYLSLLNVSPNDILDAAQKVCASFNNTNPDNQILVQPMLLNIVMSGVLFTVDPNTGGNYFVINYDECTGSSESITSGKMADSSTCYIFHGKKCGNYRLDSLAEAAAELMELFNRNNIDIEFAFTTDETLYILQARPLVLKKEIADIEKQHEALARAHSFISRGMGIHPYAQGKRTIYGVMSDWNPAEMIGIRPKPLASSLYRKLITDRQWAYQRNEYGYKNLRSFPLMVEFCGLPYIDIRISFNSFIPGDIDDQLSDKLANYYLDSLANDPDKHDKVEFEIVFSCNTFDLQKRLGVLSSHGFTQQEIDTLRNSLCNLTNNIINITDGLWIIDTKKIDILDKRREIVISSDMDDISKIYWLIEDCSRYGTLPFAGLARAGFIAVQLLKSLVSIGILSERDYQNYMGSLKTISSEMSSDWQELSQPAFLRKYGHLRPGTYDITSNRYDMAPEMYLGSQINDASTISREPFALSLEQYAAIQNEMKNQGLHGDVLALFKFIKAGIEGREYSKFVFTKSLSYMLELFAKLGETYGFSREDMAYMDYFLVEKIYSSTTDIKSFFADAIQEGKKRHAETLTFTMPPVILNPDDIYAFHMPTSIPNYITLGEVAGEVCSKDLCKDNISGKILLIKAADPGFDWIFSCNIKGFVTAYGGANSHMAIRAGELGIPAAIGVGEKVFERLSNAKKLRIDCANRKIEEL